MASTFNGDISGCDGSASVKADLEGFIAFQIRHQEKNSKENDNLDKEKRDQFIARALAVNKRMNREIAKAQEKTKMLNDEFGKSNVAEWTNEHAEEVLTKKKPEPDE